MACEFGVSGYNVSPVPYRQVSEGSLIGTTKEYSMPQEQEELAGDVLRVGAGSNTKSVASAIAHAVYEQRTVKIRAIGAGAVNQAVKSIAIARGYVAPRGFDLNCTPGFATVPSRDGDISAIVFTVSTS